MNKRLLKNLGLSLHYTPAEKFQRHYSLAASILKIMPLAFISSLALAASELSLIPEPYLLPRYLAPDDAASSIVVADVDEPGERVEVSGQVLDGQIPLSDVSIFVFHTDQAGNYAVGENNFDGELNPRLFGLLRTDGEGKYSYKTIRPGSYNNNASHIHYVLRVPGYKPRLVDLWFDDDPILEQRSNAGEPAVPSAIKDSTVCNSIPDCVVISPVTKDSNGTWHASRDIQMFSE